MTRNGHQERHRWLFTAVVAVAALLLVACGQTEAKNPVPAGSAPGPLVVSSVAVQQRSLPEALDVTGTLMADAQTDVASEIDGRIIDVAVERGRVVSAGTLVARLDDRDAINLLREAEATEAQIQARLGVTTGQAFDPRETPDARKARVTMERAEMDYRRYAQLVDQGAVSRSEYDLKRTDFLATKEQLDATINQERQAYQTLEAQKARVAMAHKALADTVIHAPYAGLIAEKHVNVGDYAKKGARIATLVRVDPLRVELTIPEGAVASVRRGQKVSFTVQSHPGRTFDGVIAYVGPTLRADSRALVVEALVPNTQGILQPGLFATARIELPGTTSKAFVPAAAVQTEAGVSRLFVVENDHVELRFVQLGRQVDDLVEIIRGVSPGERVATGALERLADGVPVTEAGTEGLKAAGPRSRDQLTAPHDAMATERQGGQ